MLPPNLKSAIQAKTRQKVEGLRSLKESRASRDEIEKYIDNMLRSTEFYETLGELKNSTPNAIAAEFWNEGKETDEEAYLAAHKYCWDRFTKAQEDADTFFGDSIMRTWVIARALKDADKGMTWEMIDEILQENVRWKKRFRSEEWWYVPWAFFIADEVQRRTGVASCNSERFSSMWDELTNDKAVNEFLSTLSKDQIEYYRCTD